jgi:hypothetical protein
LQTPHDGPMSDVMSETCECREHGEQPVTLVCKHILAASGEIGGFVTYESQHEDDLRDAWCEVCEAHLNARGGDRAEGSVEVPDGFFPLCAQCYRAREANARRAGRRFIHRA